MVADHILQTDSSPHNPLTSNEIGFRKFGNVSTLDRYIRQDIRRASIKNAVCVEKFTHTVTAKTHIAAQKNAAVS